MGPLSSVHHLRPNAPSATLASLLVFNSASSHWNTNASVVTFSLTLPSKLAAPVAAPPHLSGFWKYKLQNQATIVWLSNIQSSDHSVIRSSNYPIIKSSDHPIPDSAIFPPIAQWSKADGLYFIGLKNISFSSVEVLFLRGFVFLSHIIILPHHVYF